MFPKNGGDGFVTCTGGKWPDDSTRRDCSTPLDPRTDQTCVTLSDLPNAHKAVCGDAACSHEPAWQCTDTGQIQYCKDGKLQAAVDCPTGQTCGGPGKCVDGDACQVGETWCFDSDGYRTCDNGQWSKRYLSCAAAASGALKLCLNTTDPAGGLRKAVCVDPGTDCTPGAQRCTADLSGVETCGTDRKWAGATSCLVGRCDVSSGSCSAACKPDQQLCGGATSSVFGQLGYKKAGRCSHTGTLPDWTGVPDCAGTSFCRYDGAGNYLGCVDCVGAVRTSNGFVDTKCSADGKSVIFCADDNTWAADSNKQSCGVAACVPAVNNQPAICP